MCSKPSVFACSNGEYGNILNEQDHLIYILILSSICAVCLCIIFHFFPHHDYDSELHTVSSYAYGKKLFRSF
jgi:hypothetical protein